jgi:hypothetical protein
MAETLYQKRQAAKRSSRDIQRLQQTYSKAVEDYQAETGQALSQFETKVGEYESAYGTYEQKYNQYQQNIADFNARVLAYQTRVQDYNQKLEAYATEKPLTYSKGAAYRIWDGYNWAGSIPLSGDIKVSQIYGQNYYYFGTPLTYAQNKYGGAYTKDVTDTLNKAVKYIGSSGFVLKPGYEFAPTEFSKGGMSGYIYERGGPDPGEFTEKFEEKFTEVAPEAPVEPEAPDTSAALAKLNEEKAILERETAERTKARTRAVQRGQQRPMLSSGTTLKPKA